MNQNHLKYKGYMLLDLQKICQYGIARTLSIIALGQGIDGSADLAVERKARLCRDRRIL